MNIIDKVYVVIERDCFNHIGGCFSNKETAEIYCGELLGVSLVVQELKVSHYKYHNKNNTALIKEANKMSLNKRSPE